MTDVNECLESSKKNTTYFLTDSNSSEIITSEYNGLQTSVKDVVRRADLNLLSVWPKSGILENSDSGNTMLNSNVMSVDWML